MGIDQVSRQAGRQADRQTGARHTHAKHSPADAKPLDLHLGRLGSPGGTRYKKCGKECCRHGARHGNAYEERGRCRKMRKLRSILQATRTHARTHWNGRRDRRTSSYWNIVGMGLIGISY